MNISATLIYNADFHLTNNEMLTVQGLSKLSDGVVCGEKNCCTEPLEFVH